jgi:hypothetical protein
VANNWANELLTEGVDGEREKGDDGAKSGKVATVPISR